ncbi:WbqC family protein [Salinarimonas rosea]|uniref:WbqC family protein n=1 Tax=Salinarimonas rosea TaxID=552063 RepID=UPI000427B59D|nr:WbqC family protein [Salinarimonas rosea]
MMQEPAGETVVVATQSNYVPWRGYFAQMRRASTFVLLDCVQFTRRDWRNRNRIKTPNGLAWLTIPVESRGRFQQAIDETRVSDPSWAQAHLRSLDASYRRAAAFEAEFRWIADAYEAVGREDMLSVINRELLVAFARRLGIATPIVPCDAVLPRADLLAMDPSRRLLELCRALGATRYLSGPAARDYLDVALFERAGILVEWMDYSGLAPYPQCWGGFEPAVSILDLVLNVGSAEGGRRITG